MNEDHSVFPLAAAEVSHWGLEADVVVVGYGGAGVSAALAARAAGAEVLVLERTGAPGGSAGHSAGYLYLGGGTALQRACGFEDTAEEMFKFLMAATGPDPDEAKITVYCDESVALFDWIVAQGVPFKASLYGDPTWEVLTDDGLAWSGGENAYPFNEIARPAPRAHIPQLQGKVMMQRSGGWLLMTTLTERAADAGAKVETHLRVDRLVVEADGRVAGVAGRCFGDEVAVRARRGVVLAAGGFAFNATMLAQYAPVLRRQYPVGTDTDDGRGIRMAQAVGASVRHMDAAEAGMPLAPPLLVRSVLVNRQGQRFVNEDTYPGRVGQAALYHHGGGAVAVLDHHGFEAVSPGERMGAKPDWVAEDLAELEHEAGLPPGSLRATVAFYNDHARQGQDPLFHKDPRWLRPLEPPFGAIRIRQFGVFTLGGLETTPRGEVLDLDGRVIPGLFAAGRVASGIPAWGYLSGTSLGDAVFFGRKAGAAAAQCRP